MATKKGSAKKRGGSKGGGSKRSGAKNAAVRAAAAAVEGIVEPRRAAAPLAAEAVGQFVGTVHYQSIAAILLENTGGASPLIMFRPAGNQTPADIGAAASFLRHVLGKQEGDTVTVVGNRAPIFGQQFIFVISAS